MHSDLARVLLTRGIVQSGTVIEAHQNVRSLSCQCTSMVVETFVITSAFLVNGTHVVFDTIGPEQVSYRVQAEQAIRLDGMSIERVAQAQNLTLDGRELAMRSRRGRRKKCDMADSAQTLNSN